MSPTVRDLAKGDPKILGLLMLARITAPHFVAGLILRDDTVVEAAPIIAYMACQRWHRDRVREYCRQRHWDVAVVRSP